MTASRVPEARELLAAVERGAYSSEYELRYELRKAAPELLAALCDEIHKLSTRVDRELVHLAENARALCWQAPGYESFIRLTHDYDKVVCKACFDILLIAARERIDRLQAALVDISDVGMKRSPQAMLDIVDRVLGVKQ